MSAGVHQDEQKAEQAQPDVRRDPLFHAAEGRSRVALAQAQQALEHDHARAQRGEEQAHGRLVKTVAEAIHE